MTVVGKILVILNLLFSFAVGAFAVLSYTADTHWRKSHDELSKKFQAEQTSRLAFKEEADRLTKERADLNATLARVAGKDLELKGPQDADQAAKRAAKLLEDRRQAVARLKTEADDLRAKLNEERKKNSQYETVATEAQENVKRSQSNVERLRELVKQETDKNIQVVRDMNEMRDRAVAAEIDAKSFRKMNVQLEGQLQDMARDMARVKATVGGAASTRLASGINPPPENVEGLVRRIQGNLISISIGGDAGLTRGHTMQVFRLGQNPRYVGQIRIVDVQPTQAVGQVMGRLQTPIQTGDTVASRIMGSN